MLHNMPILSLCAGEALRLHITLMLTGYWTIIGFQTICDVTNHALQIRFSLNIDKMYNCALAVKTALCCRAPHIHHSLYTHYTASSTKPVQGGKIARLVHLVILVQGQNGGGHCLPPSQQQT